jgi:hypothetical protein
MSLSTLNGNSNRDTTHFPLRLTHRQVVIAGLDPAIDHSSVKPAGDASFDVDVGREPGVGRNEAFDAVDG